MRLLKAARVVALPPSGISLLVCLSCLLEGALGFGEHQKYLIATSPASHSIAYVKLPTHGGPPTTLEPMRVLINSGLQVPQGIAVDEYRRKLYVADPDLGKLVAYDLSENGDALTVGSQLTVATGVEVRWVTVDGTGNVFFTDESKNKVFKLSAADIEAGKTNATVLYDGSTLSEVSGPGGIVADNFFVYWVNKISGTSAGALVRALASSTPITGVPGVSSLSKNVPKSYGVCLALNNIFYTDESKSFYAMPRTGGGVPSTVTTSLLEPRGCAFDGSSTVYVADRSHNAIYSVASSSQYYGTDTPLLKAADLDGAFGVAVFSRTIS